MTQRFSRRYWLKLARFVGVLALLGLIAIGVRLFQMAESLAQDALHPPRMAITQTPADLGIASYQDVSFVTSDGLTIRGWLIPGTNPVPGRAGALIILGHGNAANRQEMLGEAAILAAHGYGVLLFDWRAEGQSDGAMVSFGQFETRDLRAAVDFALAQPGVQPGKIGALGLSLGGSAMTLGAAQDDRIKAVIIEASFTTLADVAAWRTRWLPLVGPLAVELGQRQAGVDAGAVRPVDAICKISPRPVLLIYGANDDYITPGSGPQMFAAACDPKELWIVPGAGHGGYLDAQPVEYAARIVGFFDRTLGK
jgi:dipeptidyl aminopeptidase/acylaminoacyl peptidase